MIVGQNSIINQYVPTFAIKNLYDGQTLVYDSVRKAFVNATATVVTSSTLGELLNVSPTVDSPSISLTNGQSLIYSSLTSLWSNSFVDYNTLLNQPTSSNFSFSGLRDTTKPTLPNGYVLWNSTGTQLVYAASIPASSISGLSPVAIEGTLGSLLNVLPSADTLNNTTDVGKTLAWNGIRWVPVTAGSSSSYVVNDLAEKDALPAILGTQAYVINSDDGIGNYVNQWSMWIYSGASTLAGWTSISRQVSALSESITAEYTIQPPYVINSNNYHIASLTTGGRITLITIKVSVAFDSASGLEIGYEIPSAGISRPSALMNTDEIDLSSIGTFSVNTNVLFGSDTPTGDVNITAAFISAGEAAGVAQIIVSYV